VNLSSTSVFLLALHHVAAMAIDARELVAEDNTLICGGSLVTKDMVLTAAHCEFQHASKVLVGALCKPYGPNDANNCNQKVEFIEIEEVFNHDKYNGRNLDYDYALVKLKEKSSINPVGLDIIGKGNKFNRGMLYCFSYFETIKYFVPACSKEMQVSSFSILRIQFTQVMNSLSQDLVLLTT